VEGDEGTGDRRQRRERREGEPPDGQSGDRRDARRATSPLIYVLQSIGAVIVLMAVIVFAVRTMNPVYATRGTLGDELRKHAPGAAAAIGAGDSTNVDRLMATDKFQQEKRNFYEDVMRLKQVDSARADSIAQYAVREAYVRGISPAIIFGVMLTENAKFISKAQSNVGAVGLMQVYPKVWLTKEMTKLFGRDLASDSTNVKYGVFILSHYFNPQTKGGGTTERDWATALLRYNGCVRGTNTPRCHTYPNKVQNFVEQQATSICNGRTFYDCIAKPFIDGLFKGGKLAPDDSSTKAVVATAAAIASDPSSGASVVAAGEVSGGAERAIVVPPVVVTRPDSAPNLLATPAISAPAVVGAVTGKSASRAGAKSVSVKKASAKTSAKVRPTRKASSKPPARKVPARKTPVKKTPAKRPAPLPALPKAITIKVP
jgi:hypothetical protein